MPGLSRILVVLLTLALAATGVTACGGGGGSSSGSDAASGLLKETFGPNHPIRSGKLDLSLDLDLKGLPKLPAPVSIRLNGPFQSNGAGTLPNFNFALDLVSGSQPVTLGAVSTGRTGFLTLEGQAFDIGPDLYASFKKGYAAAQSKSKSNSGTPSLKALGIEPLRWLRNPQRAGTEDIAGTRTIHLTSDVDVQRLLADISSLLDKAKGLKVAGTTTPVTVSLSAQQRQQIERAVQSATVDLWTGEADRTLRKLALEVKLDVPQDVRSSIGGLQSGRIAFQFTIAELNKAQTIVAPKDSRPIGDLTKVLKQITGSSTASSSASGSSSSSSSAGSSSGSSSSSASSSAAGTATQPAPASGPQKAYLDCIQKAGTDIARIQRCSALLQ